MTQVKTKRDWHPSPTERQVSEIARYDAEREAARTPWPVLQEAREKYIAWEAFSLWVNAIEHTEGGLPDWLAKTVERRFPGFVRFVAEQKRNHAKEAPPFWDHLRRWIYKLVFAAPWREGWMNAVGCYARG